MSRPQCSRCHKPLSDPFSIAVEMGPECRGKLLKRGWKFPKPHYRIRAGRVQFLGMTGKVEPPTRNADLPKQKKEKTHEYDEGD